MKTIHEVLEGLEREALASLGVWAGGVATSLHTIMLALEQEGHTGFRVYTDPSVSVPSEGRDVYIGCDRTANVILEQHWHGGPASGVTPQIPMSFVQVM